MAIAAVKRVGNSPARHRHVRKLREFYRLNKDLFAADTHYLLLMRAPVEDWAEFEIRLKLLLRRILISPPPFTGGQGGV